MDPRTLVMTSGPEELPFQQNELFESDFSNAVAQVNFELNAEPCLGDLSSAYDGEKCSWEQPWQDAEDKMSSHMPIKAQCDSLDIFCNELSTPGHIFSTISNELFVQEGELTSSSLEFNTGVFIDSDMDQTTEGAAKKDTDQNSFDGYNSIEHVNSFVTESLCDSNPKDLITTSNRQTESYNGEPCETLEVAPERLFCEEEMETNQEANEANSMMDLDFCQAAEEYPLHATKDEDDRITTKDGHDQILKNGEDDQVMGKDDDDQIPKNDEEDQVMRKNEDDQTSKNDEDDQVMRKNEDDQTSKNDEDDQVMGKDEDDQIPKNDEDDQMTPDIMEQDLPPCQNPGNNVSKPSTPANPVAIEMKNASPQTEKFEPLLDMPSSETVTEPNGVDGTSAAPLSDHNEHVTATSVHLKPFDQMCRFHPVVLIQQNEPVNPISDVFQCATCKHVTESADFLIEHHYSCHPESNHGTIEHEEAEENVCHVTDASLSVLSPCGIKKERFKGPYMCRKCGIKFTKIYVYVTHMREHTGETPYVCDVCGRYFSQAGTLRRHKIYARICNPLNSGRRGVCKKSQREVASEENDQMPECRVKLRKITKVHECTSCHKTFLSMVKAKKHYYNVHSGKTGETMSSLIITKYISKQMAAAKETKTEPEYTFKCPICPRLFKYCFNRGRHLRKCVREKISNGQEKVGGKYQCPLCPTTFTSTSSRFRHIQNICLKNTVRRLSNRHVEFRSFKPTEEQKANVQSLKGEEHKRESEPKKNVAKTKNEPLKNPKSQQKFICRHCPAAYWYLSGLYRHMRKHRLALLTGDKVRYRKSGMTVNAPNDEISKSMRRCRVCGKHFGTLSAVKKHELIHTSVKPHVCQKCGRQFAKHSDLIGHKGVHQGRIQCSSCPKILPTIGKLIQHCKLRHQSGNLRCPDCLQVFKDLTLFVRHLETLKTEDHPEDESLEQPSEEMPRPNKNVDPQITNVKETAQTETKALHRCTICQSVFRGKNMLHGHLIGHKLNTLIKCQDCGQCFGRKRIQFHVQQCRNNRPKPKVDPPVTVNTVTENQPPPKCSICQRTFTRKNHLMRHLRAHNAKTLILCNTCGYYFGPSKVHAHQKFCKKSEKKTAPPPATETIPPATETVPAAAETIPPAMETVPPAAETIPPAKGTNTCTICGRVLFNKGRLLTHLIAHRNKTLVSCPGCREYFSYRKLPFHQLRCKLSRKPNNQLSVAPNPQETTVQETPSQSAVRKRPVFKCPYCPQQFKFKSLLLRHTNKHTGLQPYPCSLCGEGFSSHLLSLQHQQMCSKVEGDSAENNNDDKKKSSNMSSPEEKSPCPPKDDSLYKCTFCNKSFLKARNLRRHILTHNEAKPYRCKACQSSFSRFDHLKVHQANCKVKRMRLEVCIPKISPEDVGRGWKRTLDTHSPESQEPLDSLDSLDSLECKFCFKTLPAKSTLARHITLFHAVKHFKCTRCGSAFSHEKSLKHHEKNSMCRKVLKNKSTSRSMNNDTKSLDEVKSATLKSPPPDLESNYSCKYCPRTFKNRSTLQNHMHLHSGLKPYSCEYCGESFPRKDYVKRHHIKCTVLNEKSEEPRESSQENETPEAPLKEKLTRGFSCAYCSARFSLFSQLQEHFLNVHQLETADQPETTASLQHHLSNMSGANKDSEEGSLDKELSNRSNLTCELDPILNVDAPKTFHCTKCDKFFKNTSAFQAHLRSHALNPYFHCIKCRKGFWNRMALTKHKRKCRPGKALNHLKHSEANVAQTVTDSQLSLNISTKTTSPSVVLSTKSNPETSGKSQKTEVRYQCSECHKAFTDGLLLITHLEDHRKQELEKKQHTCSKCGKICGSQANLDKHMRIHYNDKKHSCPDCSKVLNSQSELDVHRSLHDPTRAYACKLCTYRFNSGPTLCAHYAEEHPNDMFTCRFCKRTYSVESSLVRHYKKHHKDEVENKVSQIAASCDGETDVSEDENGEDSDSDAAPYFPCHVCGKTFTTSESLEDHQRCHLGEKPHECAECGRCFFLAGQLEQHQRMHKSEYQCPLCGKGFVSLFALRKHKNTHSKSRSHRCTKCQLTFNGAAQLAEHMASHVEENFPCDICNLVFHSKSSRFEHRKIHTFERSPTSGQNTSPKYQCGICHERFHDPEALSEHGCKAAQERRYTCQTCDKHFLHASHLIKHRFTQHPGVEHSTDSLTQDLKEEMDLSTDFVCSVCNVYFADSQELNEHFSTHSREIFIKKEEPCTSKIEISCADCNRCFSGSKAYNMHVCPKQTKLSTPPVKNTQTAAKEDEEVDVIGDDLYNCLDCLESFTCQSALLEHQNLFHGSVKSHKCPLCGKTFAFRRYLMKHIKRHKAKQDSANKAIETKFNCGQCGAALASEQELSWHTSLHAKRGEGHYSCDMCHQSFKHWSLFKQHQESHMGQVVYECTECDKAFAFPHLLDEHQLTHASHR